MARILIIHSGLRGISNACLEMAKRLKNDNHHLCIASMRNDGEQVLSNGLDYLQITPISFDYRSSSHSSYEQILKDLDFEGFENDLKKLEIDLVLIDMELHEYILFLWSRKFPFLLISQWFSIWRTKNNLPPFSQYAPKSMLQQNLLWNYSYLKGQLNTLLSTFRAKSYKRRNFIFYLANQFDIDPGEFISFHFPLPFSYKSLPVLSMTHPELEFNQSASRRPKYVYPMVCIDRTENVSDSFASDFQQILSTVESERKKLILVTRSSMDKSSKLIIPNLLEALADSEDCISILSLGKHYDAYKSYHQQKNIFVYESVPQLQVLSKAHLSINHGGIHTINECIHYKVPMLILSGKKFDQNGCAVRVEYNGCGKASFSDSISSAELKRLIHKVLNTKSYGENIKSLNASYQESKKHKVLENYISEFISET